MQWSTSRECAAGSLGVPGGIDRVHTSLVLPVVAPYGTAEHHHGGGQQEEQPRVEREEQHHRGDTGQRHRSGHQPLWERHAVAHGHGLLAIGDRRR